MPWGSDTNWTEEDLHAAVVHLRHRKPIRHQIPEPIVGRPGLSVAGSVEEAYSLKDYGAK